MIELRSDTFTLPTADMFQASAHASLGDDVWGEDPTVMALEAKAAALLGKEAALFVTSGTQGNLIAILSHTSRGNEVIVGDKSHIFNAEAAGSAVIGGIQLRVVRNTSRGTLEQPALQSAIRPDDIHYPRTALICVENTHNHAGGAVLSLDDMADVREVADEADIRVHLDGARVFNAAVALSVNPAEIAAYADSVTFCLSKGLSAPIGSVLCGSEGFVAHARRYRKMLGGGMRQAGVIAAPGVVALDSMVDRLADDHANARRLGEALDQMPGVIVDLGTLQTNIVVADFSETGWTAAEVVDAVAQRGVKVASVGPFLVRMVTHRGVTSDQVSQAIDVFQGVLTRAEIAVGA